MRLSQREANERVDMILQQFGALTLQNTQLRIALHDAINAPKGVVPTSAEPFYQPQRAHND